MRIISGLAKGKGLEVPKGEVRPTTDRVREALFSILSDRVEGADVLDLFAGSGALGLEALSRGAKSAKFVDAARHSTFVIDKNLKCTGLKGGHVFLSDALKYVARESRGFSRFDLIFVDPPYCKSATDRDFLLELLEGGDIAHLLKPDGILVGEAESGWGIAKKDAPTPDGWVLLTRREYGKNTLFFWQLTTNLPDTEEL